MIRLDALARLATFRATELASPKPCPDFLAWIGDTETALNAAATDEAAACFIAEVDAVAGLDLAPMTYAAVIRAPGAPPSQVPPFAADSDAAALAIVQMVAARTGAQVVMAWESRDGQSRRIA